jgi:two-component system sensor histidine kinase VicK
LSAAVNNNYEKTEVIYGSENIIDLAIQGYRKVQDKLDICTDYTGPILFLSVKPIWEAYTQLKSRAKLRFISEITQENILYCKEIMRDAECRHLDGTKGNFGVDGKQYWAHATTSPQGKPIEQMVFSTVNALVEQQQYFFDMLWNKAIPAKQRIKEIEQGDKREFIETVREPKEIYRLVHDLIKSAIEEIVILFPSANAFRNYQEYTDLVQLLNGVLSNHQLRIRILLDSEDSLNKLLADHLKGKEGEAIRIQHYSNKTGQTKITTFVVDNAYSLTIEVKDGSASSFDEAIGLATYSNSESTVRSYLLIFETLWIQSELYEQKKQNNVIGSICLLVLPLLFQLNC